MYGFIIGIALFVSPYSFSPTPGDTVPTAQAARLDSGLLPLTKLLEFPQHLPKEGSLTVSFSVDVSTNGRLSHFRILQAKSIPKKFAQKMLRSVARARVQPARMDGRPVRVGLNGSIVYSRRRTSSTIQILPHSGFEHPDLGWNYRGPQLVGGYRGLLRRMRNRVALLTQTYAAVSFDVSDTGDRSGFITLSDRPGGQGMASTLAQVLASTVFISATSHGKPVTARTRWIFDGHKRGGVGLFR